MGPHPVPRSSPPLRSGAGARQPVPSPETLPATFQRMMDQLLRPHQAYAAAYIDDIIIHSASWDVHLRQLRAVLGELRRAGLTANPAKCRLGLEETSYLGYQVGRGNVRPQESKVAAIRDWPRPTSKKLVKSFLGLVGYCRVKLWF